MWCYNVLQRVDGVVDGSAVMAADPNAGPAAAVNASANASMHMHSTDVHPLPVMQQPSMIQPQALPPGAVSMQGHLEQRRFGQQQQQQRGEQVQEVVCIHLPQLPAELWMGPGWAHIACDDDTACVMLQECMHEQLTIM